MLKLVEDLPEFPRAGLAGQPLRSSHRAQSEAAARKGVVPQNKHIMIACCGHNMFTFGVAKAVRADGNLDARLSALDDLLQSDRCP